MKRKKECWLFLDGKKHCNVLQWALAANMSLSEAKTALAEMYKRFAVEFRLV